MPMPKPGMDESRDEFMDRCMGDTMMGDEFPDADQRVSVCSTMWGDKSLNNRAHSVFTIKSVDADQRVIHGIASTPAPDRMEDVVVPSGVKFKLPLPFLYQHNADRPIGHVTKADVTNEGIAITAQIAKGVAPFIDEAWALIKAGLVRGLSIGFRPLEDPVPIKGTYGLKFNAWEWYELSAVTIPANADASILTIKSADRAQLAASGDRQKRVVRLNTPGASGKQIEQLKWAKQDVAHCFTVPKGTGMKTIAEQISSFEAKRAANVERMNAIMAKAADDGRTLDETETQDYETVKSEVKAVDEHLVRLREHETAVVAKAVAIVSSKTDEPHTASAVRANSGIISVGPRLEPGIPFARYALALARTHGNRHEALQQVQNNKRWMDQTPEVAMMLKTAIPAADTTTAGWASELVYAQNLQGEFLDYLRPMTILGRLTQVRRVPFNVRWASLTSGTTGYWVGQGKAIPMSKGATGSQTLGITKAAGMAAYDDEVLKSSSPSIELMVRDDLAKAVAQVIDVAFIDPNNGGLLNEKPASVLYGITPTAASGTNAAAVSTDVAAVFSAAIAAELDPMTGVWVMTPTTALKLSMMQTSLGQSQYPGITIKGGTWQGLPVIVSSNAFISGSPDFGNMIVLILQNEIAVADEGGVDIQISNEASIEMLDNPTNLSTGATAPTTVVSMFQTQSWAIKAVRYVNWLKRRSAAAAYIRNALYA